MYLEYKKTRDFEDKVGYENIMAKNIKIGNFLNFEPEIEYAICSGSSCCYSPKNVCSSYSDWRSQKSECERWLSENIKDYPNGWVAKGNYKPTKLEYYPNFHLDWNHLMEAINRLSQKGFKIPISPDDIFHTWELVYNNCN